MAKRTLPNLSGITFGRLYALRRVGTEKGSQWYCFCSCGGRTLATTGALRKGNKRSCGCLRLESLEVARAERARKKAQSQQGAGASFQDTQATDHAVDHLDAVDDAVYSLGIKPLSD
jgi:hypothetical protein